MAKEAAKEAKAEAKAKAKSMAKTRKRKLGDDAKEDDDAKEVPVKGARSKAKSTPDKSDKPADVKPRAKAKSAAKQISPSQLPPDARKVLADQAFEVLKKAEISELTSGRDLGDKKSFSVGPADKKGSTIGVILYSTSFYVYDAVDEKDWDAQCRDVGYKVMASAEVSSLIWPSCIVLVGVVTSSAN